LPESGPFALADDRAYGRWRARKLRLYPRAAAQQRVPIARLNGLDAAERAAIVDACRRANFALYRTDPGNPPDAQALRAFGAGLGLVRFDRHLWARKDGIVALRKETGAGRGSYIPYTDRPMKWHTDGYYNSPGAEVGGVIMHCAAQAAEGGANGLLDHEMVYIALRDANPAYIEALMQPDAMTIPENTLEPGVSRGEVCGPVFSLDPADGSLHMRYTARTRSIRWKEDAVTREAVAFLEELLAPPVAFAFSVRLEPGEGIVCNNVLHSREAFTDGAGANQKRLLWRARYRQRVAGTSCWNGDGP
jgi:hypothetical protein